MRSTATIVVGIVGVIVAMLLVLLLIVLPSADEECGPGQVATRPQVGDCTPTGSPAEKGLQPDTLRVMRCVAAHFGIKDFSGKRSDALPDHPSGRAVDFLLDGVDGVPSWQTDEGKAKGDQIVAFVQQNALAFGVDYLIWRQRSWTPDPSGAGVGSWQPMSDRGSATQNHMDHVHVTTKGNSTGAGDDSDVSLAGAVGTTPQPSTESGSTSGESEAGVNEAGRLVGSAGRHHPMGGAFRISDPFGARGGAHKGVDFAASAGTPILAAASGKVVAAGPASGFGNWVVIDSVSANGVRFSTVYGHMTRSGVLVHTGDAVRAGQHIANVGSAGESSGPHLHFELVPGGRFNGGKPVDPIPWLRGAPMSGPQSGDYRCANGFGTAGGNLADGKMPPELAIWYRRAGSLCPQIQPSLLAAQGRQESGFRRGSTSPAGALGLAQFLPGTAAAKDPDDGQPYVIDADGNGVASVWDDGDAIVGQGRYMCAIAKQIDTWKSQGKVKGNTVALTLAAYNAGEGAVLRSGGMPDLVPGHFSETQPYVRNILAAEAQFRSPGGSGRFEPDKNGGLGGQVLSAGMQWLGAPYAFGGGGPEGPTGGGFDMPGLTSAAVSAATGGSVSLPRTVEQQWGVGAEVSLEQAKPGDLVFGDFGRTGPTQVGIYAGGQSMVIAKSGGKVSKAPLGPGMRARRVG